MRRHVLPLFFVATLLLTACGQESTPAKTESQQAPDFTLKTLDGTSYTLSQLRGKVIFLNFWGTFCPPCRAEMPSMERLNTVFAGKDFVMLAVNIEENGATVLPDFLRQYPHSFPILLDTEAKVQNLYGVYQVPETFIIDKRGRVLERVVGARDWSSTSALQQFRALIDAP
jgi:peroxiredoxin